MFSNVIIIGICISLILIAIYFYWAYFYYRLSKSRIGIRASSKYIKEIKENDPSKTNIELSTHSIKFSPNKTQVLVRFNIFQKNPYKFLNTSSKIYNIVNEQKKCITNTIETRIDSEYCQGTLSENQKDKCTPWKPGLGTQCQGIFENNEHQNKCYKQSTTGLDCLWL